MRTNIPHGISQTARTHPFFIILRKLSEREERIFRSSTCGMDIRIILFTIPFVIATFLLFIPIGILFSITVIYIILQHRNFMVRDIIPNLVFPKVNKMIYTDDYSSTELNYENLVNLIGLSGENYAAMKYHSRYIMSMSIAFTVILTIGAIFAHFL